MPYTLRANSMARSLASRCVAHQTWAHPKSHAAQESSTGADKSSSKVEPRRARSQATCEGLTSSAPATSRAQLSQRSPPARAERREGAGSPQAQQASRTGLQPACAQTLRA